MYGLKYLKLGDSCYLSQFISKGGLVIMSDTGYAPSTAELCPQSKSQVTAGSPTRMYSVKSHADIDHGTVCSALALNKPYSG
jgi:hypothetical protein